MTAPTPEVDGSLVELLAGHEWSPGLNSCRCGWDDPGHVEGACGSEDRHRTHLARVVQGWADKRVAGAVGEALEEAAAAVERRRDAEHIGPGSWSFGATEPFWLGDRFYDIAARIVREQAR